MKAHTQWCSFFLILFVGLYTPAYAAEATFAKWCGSHAYNVNHPLAWPQLKDDVNRLLSENDPTGAYDVVSEEFRAYVELLGGGNAKTMRVASTFDRYIHLIQVPGNETPAVWAPTRLPGNENLFYNLLIEQDVPMLIPCSVFKANASPSYERAIAYALDAMERVGSGDTLKLVQSVAYAVSGRAYKSYERMVFDGLAMWPWEMWLNGKLVPSDFKQPAPLYQLAFLRPNVSPALKFDGTENSELDYGFMLEPIGYVRYSDSSYKSWWGVSTLITATDDNGIGYGALLRWDEMTLGLAYHEKDESTLMFVSIDLYKYILGEESRSNSAKSFLRGVKGKLLEDIQN